jgi:membrane associated rhomboid family serine protease
MFIPIGDDCVRYRKPYVTLSLIAINVAIHIYGFTLSKPDYVDFVAKYASLHNHITLTRAITSCFLHADIFHLLGNMWFLFLFGSSVEGKLGHHWMALTYFVCMITSDLSQQLSFSHYVISLGASGAVGGIIGAYWFLFSQSQINFFYWIGWFWYGEMWLGVYWAVAWLFGWDLLWWIVEWKYQMNNGIAHGAHLGGLISGLLCGFLLRRFAHVTLDGDDMYTRFMMWRLKRNAPPQPFMPNVMVSPARTAAYRGPAQPHPLDPPNARPPEQEKPNTDPLPFE